MRKLVVSDNAPDRQANVRRWADLQKLYGAGVISDGLLQCLNGGLDDWSHCLTSRSASSPVVSAGASPASSAAAQAPGESVEASPVYSSLEEAQDALLQLLLRRVLCVDEHPTVTRMFTFKPHVECLLLMDFLSIFDDVVKMARGTAARAEFQARFQGVGLHACSGHLAVLATNDARRVLDGPRAAYVRTDGALR